MSRTDLSEVAWADSILLFYLSRHVPLDLLSLSAKDQTGPFPLIPLFPVACRGSVLSSSEILIPTRSELHQHPRTSDDLS